MKILVESGNNVLGVVSTDHARLSTAHVNQLEYREIRSKFMNRDGTYPFTGSLVNAIITEMRAPSISYPYRLSHNEMVEKFSPAVLGKIEDICKFVRSTWMFEVSRAKSTFPPRETFELKKQKLLPESLSSLSSSVKAIIIDRCEAVSWLPVTLELSLNATVVELAMCDCRLTDDNAEPLWTMTRLRRLSLGTNGLLHRKQPFD